MFVMLTAGTQGTITKPSWTPKKWHGEGSETQ